MDKVPPQMNLFIVDFIPSGCDYAILLPSGSEKNDNDPGKSVG